MVKMINKAGGITFVDESRVEEYKRLGHKLASFPEKEESPKKAKRKKEDK